MDFNLSRNKSTEILENEIKNAESIEQFKRNNETEFEKSDLAGYLKQLLAKYNQDKSAVFSRARMLETNYGYEIFNGKKTNVSRDKLIQICFGFPLTLDETKTVLRLGNVRPLYPRNERDAYIMFALKNGFTIEATDELLYVHNMNTIT